MKDVTGNKERIFKEAARQFKAAGYRATTNVTIANRLDVSPTMINHFFGSKSKLYAEIFGHDPLTEDQGRDAATLLGAILTAIESKDPILSSDVFEMKLRAFIGDLGLPPVGLSPRWRDETDFEYLDRQFEGLWNADAETPSCEICNGYLWANDDVVEDKDLGTTHFECNKDSPIVDLDSGEPLADQSLKDVSLKYGEGGL